MTQGKICPYTEIINVEQEDSSKALYAIWLGSWISSLLKKMQRKLSEIYVMLIVDNKLSIVQPVLLLQELHWDELYFALPLYLK